MNKDVYLDAGLRAHIESQAWKNYRKIANYNVEDLIQDGYLCYYKCHSRYVGRRGLVNRKGEPCRYLPLFEPDHTAQKHFQALVKTTFGNYIRDLIHRQPRGAELAISSIVDTGDPVAVEQFWEKNSVPQSEVASVTALLASAPQEVRALFAVLINDAFEIAVARAKAPNWLPGLQRFKIGRRRGLRETTNEYYCRLLGIPTCDIEGVVERHFLRD